MENEVPIKSIPANLEAERAVLGSLLIDPDAIIKVANFLRVEDFFRERHGWLYDVMLTLHERREPLDFVTVVDELERRGQLEEIGGPAYITDLIGGTPTSINIDFYARIVERTALLRRLISAAGQIAELAYDESQEVGEVIDRAETLIFGVSEARIHRDLMPIRAIMGNVVDRIDFLTRNKDTLMGVPTGFTMLDRLLGGMQKSDLIILAARPAMGKCVTADTLLLDPDTGARHTIADLVAQRSARLLTLDESYRLCAGAASDFVDDGVKPVYRRGDGIGARGEGYSFPSIPDDRRLAAPASIARGRSHRRAAAPAGFRQRRTCGCTSEGAGVPACRWMCDGCVSSIYQRQRKTAR